MYKVNFTNQFKKDLKLAQSQGKDMNKLKEVVDMLANGKELPAKYRDHNLVGVYSSFRECHIMPDWLLIYKIYDDELILLLNRIGSHSSLFK
ncbi:MAG: type II toxin-antitoxin system YafQ family toxin [Eubacteriales bacterium]|nr:type II toxin-antitoxin system YafQ family toxin [Eubacteriales bacterium]